jgi:predicted GIY-YIG superfamily endonuclease
MKDFVLYRFFDGDKLLYIGQSIRCYDRFKQHQKREFYKRASNITLERCLSNHQLNEKEAEAIRNEKPEYNIVHNRPIKYNTSDSKIEVLAKINSEVFKYYCLEPWQLSSEVNLDFKDVHRMELILLDIYKGDKTHKELSDKYKVSTKTIQRIKRSSHHSTKVDF